MGKGLKLPGLVWGKGAIAACLTVTVPPVPDDKPLQIPQPVGISAVITFI